VRLRQCQVIGTWVWRFRIDYLRLGRRALAEVEGRRIRLQVVLAEGGLSLAAVEAEELLLPAEVGVANNSEEIIIN
jgi:hypothetical protein